MFTRGFFTDDFDPLTGPLPQIAPMSWKRIVDESREILQGRTSDEIRAVHNRLYWILTYEGAVRSRELNVIMRKEGIVKYYPSAVILLNRCRKHIELDEIEELPDGRWEEFYVVQALSLCGQSVSSEREPFPGTTLESDEHYRRQIEFSAELMLEATELLTWAHALQEFEEEASERVKIKLSEIGREGTDLRDPLIL